MAKATTTDTTPWTLGELCDYWRANLKRMTEAFDFRALGAIQEVFSMHMASLKYSQTDGLYMPNGRDAENIAVRVPSWIPKPEGKRGLARLFAELGDVFKYDYPTASELCNAIAAEFESTTNPFEQKPKAQSAAKGKRGKR